MIATVVGLLHWHDCQPSKLSAFLALWLSQVGVLSRKQHHTIWRQLSP